MILVISKTIATMKNIFKSLMLVAVAAMGFACQEANEENYTPTNPREVVMTIIADMDEETRTYISDEANGKIAWSADDKLKVIENSNMYAETSNTEIVDGKAKFTVAFTKTSAESFVYNAIFPADIVQEENTNSSIQTNRIKVITKDTQKPTATSFDSQADILVSKQLEFDAQPTELNMQFKRLVALGKISLTNLPADEKISQVVFTAGANDILAGRNYVDAVKGEVTEYGYSDFGTNVLTLNYDEAISTRDIYFTCNPFDMAEGDTFKVKVVCEDNTYTREVTIPKDRSLVFTEGDMTTFTVNMKDATIESSFVFADGVYAVIAKSSDKYYAMKGVMGSGDYMTHVEVSYDGEASTFATSDETLGWTIAAVEGGYTFKNYEGKYLLYGTSSANTAKLGNAETMTITPIDGTNQYKIAVEAKPERILGHNARDTRFAFYKGTQVHELYLVPVVTDTTPRFTVDPMEFEFDAAGGEIIFTTTPNEYLTTDISSTDDADWLTISGRGNTFTATATENNAAERSAKITFSADGAESVVVTVTQKTAVVVGGPITDKLTREFTGIATNVTNYSDWSGKVGESGAVYAGNSAGGNDAIQLRSNNSNSGIVTTASGGKVSKIVVTWQSSTADGRTLDIYGKNTAYSAATDLYSSSTQGTKLGSIVKGTSTEVTISGDYAYIGMRSKSSAMYITSIEITWETDGESGGDEPEAPAEPVKLATPTNLQAPNITENSFTLTWNAVANASGYKVTCGSEAKDVTDPTAEFTGLTANTEYNVSVVAVGDGVNYTDSDAKETTVTTLEETVVEPEQPEAKSWVRVTSKDMILSGGTFIIGYEATAKSGKIVPMRSDATSAKTTANGYHYSGTGSGATSNSSTIDMSTITDTSKYEVIITASTVAGAVNIQLSDGNYIGSPDSKNTARLYTAASANTAYGVSIGSNDVVTLKCAAATSYHTLQYNPSSPRFANYGGAQKNLVLYKLQ